MADTSEINVMATPSGAQEGHGQAGVTPRPSGHACACAASATLAQDSHGEAQATQEPTAGGAVLVGADDAARLCGISRTMWLSMDRAAQTPRPVRLGRRRLWCVDELRAWAWAGCPGRRTWEVRKERQTALQVGRRAGA